MVESPKTGSVEFGDLLRQSREARGMSRRDLAEATGLSYPYVSQLETGYRQPSPGAIQNLATVLGISLDQIFAAIGRRPADPTPAASRGLTTPAPGWVENASFAPARPGGGGVGAGAERSASGGAAVGAARHDAVGAARHVAVAAPVPQVRTAEHPPVTAAPPDAPGAADPARRSPWIVDRVVEMLADLPPQERLDSVARIQKRVVETVVEERIRERGAADR